jgi:hypothetical protein
MSIRTGASIPATLSDNRVQGIGADGERGSALLMKKNTSPSVCMCKPDRHAYSYKIVVLGHLSLSFMNMFNNCPNILIKIS